MTPALQIRARRRWSSRAHGRLEAACSPLAVSRTANTTWAASDEVPGRFAADAAVGAGHDERTSGLLGQLPRMAGHAGITGLLAAATLMTTFPRARPASTCRMPAGASPSG